MSKNNFNLIEKNIDTIKSSENWDEKIPLIKQTKNLIQEQKVYYNDLIKSLDSNISDEEFNEYKVDMSLISKFEKSKNLGKKILMYKLLKKYVENLSKNT